MEVALLPELIAAGGGGPIMAVVLFGAWLLYHWRRDQLVTHARRDEALLPGLLREWREEREKLRSRLAEAERKMGDALSAEKECLARYAEVDERLARLERPE